MVLVASKKRPVTAHEKKRHGRHHKHSHEYHKAYWPYLPMAFIVGVGILANTFWGTIQQHVLSYATDTSISGLLQATNDQRIGGGLGALKLNDKLDSAAQAKADDMATRDYWSHNTPDGNPPWTFIINAGYSYKTAGENLAYGFASSTDTVTGWMNSPGHRANIMNTTYVDVGFGIANATDYQGTGPETIVVAMYGSPQVVAAAPTEEPTHTTPAPTPQPATTTEPTPTSEPEQQAPAPKEELSVPVTANVEKTASNSEPIVATKKVARIQLLSGATAAWSTFAVSAIATVAVVVFVLRHGLLLRRVLLRSERFIQKHPAFDIALVGVATIAIILIQTDGIIR